MGVTLNAALFGVDRYAGAGPLLADLAALDMVADVQVADDRRRILWDTPAREFGFSRG